MTRLINCQEEGFDCLICVDLHEHGRGCEDCPDCNIDLAAADDATWD